MTSLLQEILNRYAAENRPHSAMLEVTHRCPCDCEHCLLVREPRDELTLDEVVDLLRQLRDEGVMQLGLTGGDPFARRDFPRILEAAHEHRFLVSVLTTGILVCEPEVTLMRRCGVRRVELSLLGAQATTHDRIMRFEGAFARTMEAARALKTAGLVVNLKATVMRSNWRELAAMRDLARGLGAEFEANVTVAPRVDGDLAPLDHALAADDVASIGPGLINAGLVPGETGHGGAPLVCNAGRTNVTIGPRGEVYPCLLFRREVGNVRDRSLRTILRDDPDPFLQAWRALTEADVQVCAACDRRERCQRCPGIAFLETGDMRAPSPSACALAGRCPPNANGDRS